MLDRMKRSFLSAALHDFLGRTDPDDTLRRIRKEIARRRSHGAPRRDLMAVLAGSSDVELFFRQLTTRRRR